MHYLVIFAAIVLILVMAFFAVKENFNIDPTITVKLNVPNLPAGTYTYNFGICGPGACTTWTEEKTALTVPTADFVLKNPISAQEYTFGGQVVDTATGYKSEWIKSSYIVPDSKAINIMNASLQNVTATSVDLIFSIKNNMSEAINSANARFNLTILGATDNIVGTPQTFEKTILAAPLAAGASVPSIKLVLPIKIRPGEKVDVKGYVVFFTDTKVIAQDILEAPKWYSTTLATTGAQLTVNVN